MYILSLIKELFFANLRGRSITSNYALSVAYSNISVKPKNQ